MYKIPSLTLSSNPVIQARVDELILDELKKYLNDPEDLDRVEKPAEPLPESPDFPITQEEAGLVDVDAVMFALSDPVKADLEDFFPNEQSKHNMNDFVSRKLIQLIKQVKAEQVYAPDLFGNMLLMKIADAAYADNVENFVSLGPDDYIADDQENCPDEWKRVAKACAKECVESDEDAFFGQEVYDSMVLAWQSLGDMFFEDLNFGHCFLLEDTDYEILLSHGLMEGLLILASPTLGYSSRDYYQIFTSVGYNVPAKVAVMQELREKE